VSSDLLIQYFLLEVANIIPFKIVNMAAFLLG